MRGHHLENFTKKLRRFSLQVTSYAKLVKMATKLEKNPIKLFKYSTKLTKNPTAI